MVPRSFVLFGAQVICVPYLAPLFRKDRFPHPDLVPRSFACLIWRPYSGKIDFLIREQTKTAEPKTKAKAKAKKAKTATKSKSTWRAIEEKPEKPKGIRAGRLADALNYGGGRLYLNITARKELLKRRRHGRTCVPRVGCRGRRLCKCLILGAPSVRKEFLKRRRHGRTCVPRVGCRFL